MSMQPSEPSGSERANGGDPRVSNLLRDTTSAIEELSNLARRLGALGDIQAADLSSSESVDELQAEFSALKDRLSALTSESRQTFIQIDKQVRTNPYLFIIGALGLGLLLGKARRP